MFRTLVYSGFPEIFKVKSYKFKKLFSANMTEDFSVTLGR